MISALRIPWPRECVVGTITTRHRSSCPGASHGVRKRAEEERRAVDALFLRRTYSESEQVHSESEGTIVSELGKVMKSGWST